jgi:hypothetical protein
MRNIIFAGVMLAASSFMVAQQAEATIVVGPNQYATTPGTNNVNSPFGAASTSSVYVLQVQYAASLFSNVAIGSQLTSIGFRLAAGGTTNSKALQYNDFEIQVGSGANAIGNLSRTFSSNMGSDTIVARSGPLTIAKNAFKADACTNARRCTTIVPTNSFYTINFTTPYTYEGGDLLITLSSVLAASTIGQIVPLDAVNAQQVHTVSTTSISGSGSSFPTSGLPVNFTYAPILQFTFANPLPAAVPEPATWGMFVGGFGLLGAATRRRRTTIRFV